MQYGGFEPLVAEMRSQVKSHFIFRNDEKTKSTL